MQKSDFEQFLINLVTTISDLSKCKRSKVGAVIISNETPLNIISFGYNGTPHGFDNCCEENGKTKSIVIHAEINAICKAAASTSSTKGSTMVVSLSPCIECAKAIIQAGISKIYYVNKYRDDSGLKLLEQSGIITQQLNGNIPKR